MTIATFAKEIKTLGVPVAYGVFEEAQKPPYMLYDMDEHDSVFADNITYAEGEHYRLELYTQYRDLKLEKAIKDLLTKNETPYEMTGSYLSDEKLRETVFYFSL